jgi:hypothetical protein
LRDLPEVEVRYLAELAQALAAGSGDPALLESVLDRLSAGLIAQGKTPEAVPHLRQLFEMRVGRDDSTAWTSGNRWLAAALAASPPRDVADVLRRLHAAADSPAGDESIVQTLSEYLEQPVTPDSLPRVATLLNELRALPATDWPDTLARLIDRVSQQLPPAPESTNSNEDPAPGR